MLKEQRLLKFRHKSFLEWLQRNTFIIYLVILGVNDDKYLTASELWVKARNLLVNKGLPMTWKDNVETLEKVTLEEFYSIFGQYPLTMSNNRLYKITCLLKENPNVECLNGRPIKYRFIR